MKIKIIKGGTLIALAPAYLWLFLVGIVFNYDIDVNVHYKDIPKGES